MVCRTFFTAKLSVVEAPGCNSEEQPGVSILTSFSKLILVVVAASRAP